jgi:hypothetical protein
MGSLAWIASIASYYKMLGLTEVLTLQNYGPQATVLQGELGKFDSIPIIVSEYQRQDLNASGVYDGVTKTKTALPGQPRRVHGRPPACRERGYGPLAVPRNRPGRDCSDPAHGLPAHDHRFGDQPDYGYRLQHLRVAFP